MLKRILIPLSILVIIAVALIIMRETREVVAIASAIHPLFGQVLLWLLLLIYAICIFVPIISFLRLPRGLLPPSAGDVHAQKAYIEKLARRLRSNRNLTNREVTVQSIESALSELAQLAHQRTVQAATVVFVSTAVSQSGRLDGLMVMVTHCRLVWQIAHLYWQRPALSDLLALYSNVAAAAFIAQNIEDMDLIKACVIPLWATRAAYPDVWVSHGHPEDAVRKLIGGRKIDRQVSSQDYDFKIAHDIEVRQLTLNYEKDLTASNMSAPIYQTHLRRLLKLAHKFKITSV